MTLPNRRLSLEEVLDEFFFSAEKPTPAMVVRACEAYPEYRQDIMELAALWSAYESSPEPAAEALGEVPEESVSRLQSYVLNLLHQKKSKPASEADIEAARAAIEQLAGGNLRRAAAAAGLGKSTLLLQKVLTRRIRDIPRSVLDSLAQYLNVWTGALETLLGPRIGGSMSYKSLDKPNAPAVETWEEAVQALPEDSAEKHRLLALQSEESV
jgi:hypothetical protein